MEDDKRPTLGNRLKARAHDGKSELYQYLSREHRTVRKALAKHDPSWAGIAAEIAASGVMGSNGKPASPQSVQKAWLRVCRDIAAEKKAWTARTAERGIQPSRLPVTWRPPVAEPARPAEPRRAPAVPQAELPPRTGTSLLDAEDLPEDVRENLAALERQFAWADRYVNPPKKED